MYISSCWSTNIGTSMCRSSEKKVINVFILASPDIFSYAYTSTYLQNHNDIIIKQTSEDFFRKISSSHFVVRVRKGLLRVLLWEGVADRTELQYFDSYGRQRCVFLVLQGCSTRGPGAQLSAGWWLSLLHLITNWSGSQTPSGVPRAPSAGCSFPYHILSPTSLIPSSSGAPSAGLSLPHLISKFSGPKLTDFLSSQSYMIVQRPLNRPLDRPLNPCNGMFDRHQAEITVMQFRGHSLPVLQSMRVP